MFEPFRPKKSPSKKPLEFTTLIQTYLLRILVPGPPAEVKLLATSTDTAIVTWMPPKQPNGEIQKYYIYVRVMDSNGRKVEPKVVPASSSEYEIRDLRKRHRYEVWVAALTKIGEGPGSPVSSFTPTNKGFINLQFQF